MERIQSRIDVNEQALLPECLTQIGLKHKLDISSIFDALIKAKLEEKEEESIKLLQFKRRGNGAVFMSASYTDNRYNHRVIRVYPVNK